MIVEGVLVDSFPGGASAPYTPGWDVAGRVVALGDGSDAALLGARVVGFSPWMDTGRGTQASLVALPVGNVATNRTISSDLFNSPRTVGHHLSAVYRKLGNSSRTELAEMEIAGPIPR